MSIIIGYAQKKQQQQNLTLGCVLSQPSRPSKVWTIERASVDNAEYVETCTSKGRCTAEYTSALRACVLHPHAGTEFPDFD